MSSDEALQQFIDARIPEKWKQEQMPGVVNAYRAAWRACNEWREREKKQTEQEIPR